jgi:hypothetical protein
MKHKNIPKWLILPVLFVLVVGLFVPCIASADPATAVTIEPASQNVGIGDAFTVDIFVDPDTDIVMAQCSLSFDFDASLVTANNVTEGNLLSQGGAPTYFLSGTIDNVAGTITGVAGAIATPGASVSQPGIFATISFTAGTAVGTSQFNLSNVIVGNLQGHAVAITVTGGEIIITGPTVNGQVAFQGRPTPPDASWITDLTVTFIQDTTVVRTENVTTDSVGNFTIPDVAAGTYNICVKSPRALSELETGVVMVSGTTTAVDFDILREGDANNDDTVFLDDYALLYAAYGSAPGDINWNDNCDFNRNGAVDLGDYALLYANYGQVGDCYAP